MLDPEKFQVTNFGHSGTTVQWEGHNPYYKQPNYTLALNSNPNIVIFMFGHNDAMTKSWNQPRFSNDFKKMLQQFQFLPSKPQIFVMIPPPSYWLTMYDIRQDLTNDVFPKLIPQLAHEVGIDDSHIIDINGMFRRKMDAQDSKIDGLFCSPRVCDGIHPTRKGERMMAEEVYRKIKKHF